MRALQVSDKFQQRPAAAQLLSASAAALQIRPWLNFRLLTVQNRNSQGKGVEKMENGAEENKKTYKLKEFLRMSATAAAVVTFPVHDQTA